MTLKETERIATTIKVYDKYKSYIIHGTHIISTTIIILYIMFYNNERFKLYSY